MARRPRPLLEYQWQCIVDIDGGFMGVAGVDVSPLAQGVHELRFQGVRQAYHVAGQGPVCVAHPGGPGLYWSYLRSAELESRFTVVYVEPVGTGGSGRPAGYDLATYVRFLGAVIDHLGQEPVYLLGHSAGGFVAQSYA